MTERQRGFTLIELMVALLVSTLLVIMLLAIFARVSFAYRQQQRVADLTQLLSASRNALQYDAQQAGLQVAQGFKLAATGAATLHKPLQIINDSAGPDEVGFYYADLSAQALMTGGTAATLDVDDASEFAIGDLVVLSTPTMVDNPIDASDAQVANFDACVLKVADVDTTSLTFDETAPWGNSGNTHCTGLVAGTSVVSKFIARRWRIDTTRPDLAALQVDTGGHLVDAAAYTDQAYNIADLQLATYFYDADATDTDDPDTDGNRDWQSGEDQETFTSAAAAFVAPLMVSMSVVARTESNVEGVYTTNSPLLTVASNTDNNTIGDRDTFALPSTGLYSGTRIYRYVTFQVDLRNMGVGR